MHAHMPLVVTLAAALALALVLGFAAARLKLPALVGYLLAGVAIGPHTPGFVADVGLAMQLAEIGVVLLMFGVGLHFSVQDLWAVRGVAVPGAIVQMAVATGLGTALALAWGWSWTAALVLGLALSVASTVVLLRALEARGALASRDGRIAVGWLVVEDLAMVLALVLLPVLVAAGAVGTAGDAVPGAGQRGVWGTLATTLLAVAAFVVLMLVAGRRLLPWLLWQIAGTGSRELFTLCVIAVAVGLAYGASALFGVSMALGAFFAGLVLRESPLGHRAADESLPFRDAFAVLFFVSVGMLFDPVVLVDRPLQVLAVTAIIIVGKSLAAAALVLLLRYPLGTALTVSASLAQIGEFSFILVAMGTALQVLPPEASSLVVAGAILSIALNPAVFAATEPIQRWLLKHAQWARNLDARHEPLAELPQNTADRFLHDQVVLVGWGVVGRAVGQSLVAQGRALIVVDASRERVEQLRAEGIPAVAGDAADPHTLVQAHIAQAQWLVLATSDATDVRPMIDVARALNPAIRVAARAANEQEAELLRKAGAQVVFAPRQALAQALAAALRDAPADGADKP